MKDKQPKTIGDVVGVEKIAEVAYESHREGGDEWGLAKHNVYIYERWMKVAQAISNLPLGEEEK